jgi:hypothetical protein
VGVERAACYKVKPYQVKPYRVRPEVLAKSREGINGEREEGWKRAPKRIREQADATT